MTEHTTGREPPRRRARETPIRLTEQERRYLVEWLRTQMTDEAESLLLKLEGLTR